jgi:APA family basic amino acid/polyamine antiporter
MSRLLRDIWSFMAAQGTKISVATATIIGMNAMIGSGIFTAPATMAAYVGPAGILAYVIVIASVWFIAQSLARVAYLYPEEGSFYVYTKQWAGHTIGLIASFSYLLGLLIAMGLLSQMAGTYLNVIFPSVSSFTLGLITICALTLLNMFGVALSAVGQHILIACTLFPLITTTILCLFKFNPTYLTPFAPYGFTNVLKATRVVIFGFFGFECAASLFNIVQDPEKNVPRALTYSILIVGAIYTFFVGSIIMSTPLHLFNDARIPLSQILKEVFPDNPWIIWAIHGAILSAILGTIHSMIWSSSNLFNLLMKKVKNSAIHQLVERGFFNMKTSVVLVSIAIITSYVTLSNPNLFFYFTAVFIVFAYMTSIVTLLTLRSEWQSGQNIKTLAGLATALMIFFFAAQGLVEELSKII